MKLNRKGQGMLEYIVILAAVLIAIIAFAGAPLSDTVRTRVLDQAATQLDEAGGAITLQ